MRLSARSPWVIHSMTTTCSSAGSPRQRNVTSTVPSAESWPSTSGVPVSSTSRQKTRKTPSRSGAVSSAACSSRRRGLSGAVECTTPPCPFASASGVTIDQDPLDVVQHRMSRKHTGRAAPQVSGDLNDTPLLHRGERLEYRVFEIGLQSRGHLLVPGGGEQPVRIEQVELFQAH